MSRGKHKVEINSKGVSELLKGEAMRNILNKKATDIKNRCGDGYENDIFVGKSRVNAMVKTSTYKANRDNKKNNIILKALR